MGTVRIGIAYHRHEEALVVDRQVPRAHIALHVALHFIGQCV